MTSVVTNENKSEQVAFQVVAEQAMPAHLKARLEERAKSRKQALSQEAIERATREANIRRDQIVAEKAQKAIESREKFFEP